MGGPVVSGQRLREAREAAGVSLLGLSARTNFSRSLLGAIETGVRTVRPEHIQAYSHALNVAVETLEAPATDPVQAALEWLVADAPIARYTAAGRRVGQTLVTQLERRVIELRHLDDSIGGRVLYPVVQAELATARSVLERAAYTDANGQRLLVVVGELAQLAGWVASDAGRYADAQKTYLDGVGAATQAGARPLAAQLLSSLSYQIANVGDAGRALLLARSAVTGAAGATPVVRALLYERVAWAAARARDGDRTREALDTVDDAYEARSSGVLEPEWVYWLDRSEIDVMAGRCFVELGDAARAQPLLSRAISSYPPEHAREIALYRTWLADAYLRTGEVDAARETIELVKGAAGEANSSRLDRRVSELQRSAV